MSMPKLQLVIGETFDEMKARELRQEREAVEALKVLCDRLIYIWHWGGGDEPYPIAQIRQAAEQQGLIASTQERPSHSGKKQLSAETRLRIFKRDKYACLHCGSREDLSLDHIIPESRGGSHDDANLQTLCRPCNSAKGTRMPT